MENRGCTFYAKPRLMPEKEAPNYRPPRSNQNIREVRNFRLATRMDCHRAARLRPVDTILRAAPLPSDLPEASPSGDQMPQKATHGIGNHIVRSMWGLVVCLDGPEPHGQLFNDYFACCCRNLDWAPFPLRICMID